MGGWAVFVPSLPTLRNKPSHWAIFFGKLVYELVFPTRDIDQLDNQQKGRRSSIWTIDRSSKRVCGWGVCSLQAIFTIALFHQ